MGRGRPAAAADCGHGGQADQDKQEVDGWDATEHGGQAALRPGRGGDAGGRGAQTALAQRQGPAGKDKIVKPDVNDDEIRAVFTADGGVLAAKLHEGISEGLNKNKATQIDPLVENLVPKGHPLLSSKFKDWDQVIKKWAEKKWPDLKDLNAAETPRFQRTRHAVRQWLEDVYPELNQTPGGSSAASGAISTSASSSAMGPSHDLIAGRRTKTKRRTARS